MTKIFPILAFKDNYIWAICNPHTKQVAIVDPGDATPVIDCLTEQNLQLTCILVTHHHYDHTGGITALLEHTDVPVISSKTLSDGEQIYLDAQQITLNVIKIPGHTLDHVAYFNNDYLFCGDTLFTGGCGRIFEGTPSQMLNSLKKLKDLAPQTKVYCGHEYTANNLRFALNVEPNNIYLQQRAAKLGTAPSTISTEIATNPFFRTDNPQVKAAVEKYCQKQLNTEVEVLANLRSWKDNF